MTNEPERRQFGGSVARLTPGARRTAELSRDKVEFHARLTLLLVIAMQDGADVKLAAYLNKVDIVKGRRWRAAGSKPKTPRQ